jgi:hypothetical protein
MGSSITLGSTMGQFPGWVSALSASSPSVLLTYQKTSPLVGLIPANSTIRDADLQDISMLNGVSSATPLIVKEVHTSLSSNPSLVVGLDINFWQLSLGLNRGHWPAPNSSQAVVTAGSSSDEVPSSIAIAGQDFQVAGVALTSNLVLVGSVVISYATAQRLFKMNNSTSILIIQVSSEANSTFVANEIDKQDASLVTIPLSSSALITSTVTKIVGAISSAIVFVEAFFAFSVLATVTVSSINSRRWEYGLVSTYGGRSSALKLILLENWLIFAIAIIPALILGIGVLGYFTFYFNSLFGAKYSLTSSLVASLGILQNNTTLLNFVAAFVASTLGSLLAIRIVLPKVLVKALVDQQT